MGQSGIVQRITSVIDGLRALRTLLDRTLHESASCAPLSESLKTYRSSTFEASLHDGDQARTGKGFTHSHEMEVVISGLGLYDLDRPVNERVWAGVPAAVRKLDHVG